MHDEFTLPVTFRNQEYNFPTRVLHYGYTIKLEVDIEGQTILFEHDEERNWRAVIPYEQMGNAQKINPELLRAVAEVIEEFTK